MHILPKNANPEDSDLTQGSPITIGWLVATCRKTHLWKEVAEPYKILYIKPNGRFRSPLNSEAARSTICVHFRKRVAVERDISSTGSSMGASQTTGSP
jgi:hypothetical protein